MEKCLTIDGAWRICALASLMGCIAFALCINLGPNGVSFSTLHSIALSIAPSIDRLSASMVDETQECNIFDGKWIYNAEASPLYKEAQCPFLSDQVSCQRNGRPDSEYIKWNWEAEGCEFPRFNATDMLQRLKNKRVVIIGDSLNRNQWESLACLLYSAIHPSRAHVSVKSSEYKVLRAMDYDCSVEFYWSPFLVQLHAENGDGNRGNKEKGRMILKLDEISTSAKKWNGADVMVFNTGHWWTHNGKFRSWDLFEHDGELMESMRIEEAMEIGMKTWAQWIDGNVDTSKTMVFFRSISVQHKGEPWCQTTTEPTGDASCAHKFPRPMVKVIEKTIEGMRVPVKYLNITELSRYRVDAHPTWYALSPTQIFEMKQRKQEHVPDWSHWCLPGLPDTWNRLLYASMVSSNSINTSNSCPAPFDASL